MPCQKKPALPPPAPAAPPPLPAAPRAPQLAATAASQLGNKPRSCLCHDLPLHRCPGPHRKRRSLAADGSCWSGPGPTARPLNTRLVCTSTSTPSPLRQPKNRTGHVAPRQPHAGELPWPHDCTTCFLRVPVPTALPAWPPAYAWTSLTAMGCSRVLWPSIATPVHLRYLHASLRHLQTLQHVNLPTATSTQVVCTTRSRTQYLALRALAVESL